MSQVAPLPPPPVESKENGPPYLRYVVFALVAALGLFIALELRLVHSSAGKEAAQRIRGDARVRAEFGDDVHIPFAVGWGLGNRAETYAYVAGKQAHGYAIVDVNVSSSPWLVSGLEVHNRDEGHLISLATPETPARPDQWQAAGSLYFVALGDAAGSDVGGSATFFEKQF